jgi:hypothetical protein
MEPVPGGRWDVALAAERSAWRQANGLASGSTKHICLSILHLITRICILYLVDDGGSVVTEFESLQTEQFPEQAIHDENVGRKNARRAHELEIGKRNARIEAKRKAGLAKQKKKVENLPVAARSTRRRKHSEGKTDSNDLGSAADKDAATSTHLPFPSCVVPETQLLSPNIEYVDEAAVAVEPLVVQTLQPVNVIYRNDLVKEFIMPIGAQWVGLEVTRDFGPKIGIYKGKITSVDTEGRRHHYHVVYDDGDEEDYDYEELEFAAEMHYKIERGTYVAPIKDLEAMSDGEGSLHVPSDADDETERSSKQQKRKRQKKVVGTDLHEPKTKRKKPTATFTFGKGKQAKSQHTIASVLEAYASDTEYEASIRAMNATDQIREVARLNKGVDKGTNIAIKSKLITAKYTEIVAGKMRQHLIDNRQPIVSMFRAANTAVRNLRLLNPEFLSVGEWVEVDADRTPGWNSEGGIGVVVSVQDALADVK